MEHRAIARTAVAVTELGFGAAPIANLYTPVTDAEAQAAVDAAWDCGIRYFDTAPHYGLGLSERRLGAALTRRRREDFVISTKVGRLLVENPTPTGSDLANGFAVSDTLTRQLDYSADGVRRSLDASLERLGLDRVDIVFVHDPVDHMDVVIREAIPALIRLRDQGVIGAVGVGMNLWEPLRRAVIETDIDVVMVAGRWTLLDRSAAPLLEACDANDCSVIAAAPFNSGILAQDWPGASSYFDYGPAPDEVLARARALARACETGGAALPQAALQFPLRHPSVAGVVAGMGTARQVTEDAALLATPVPDAAWDAITRVAG
ncbi:MAG: D-threo-aldose 1-dehydrogenase [Microbacteriaceae bacterium]|jgi:D-threo-aldose 1-dehydrogenase|nr:D-threo-aldose 1-dehydrogenase [Microbacteriaceae bacterium]